MTKKAETSSDSTLRDKNKVQETGRDVAKRLQHSSLRAGHHSLDMFERQRCAKRARPENRQVARGWGAHDCGTGRDAHSIWQKS